MSKRYTFSEAELKALMEAADDKIVSLGMWRDSEAQVATLTHARNRLQVMLANKQKVQKKK